MADIKKINLNGTEYTIKDASAEEKGKVTVGGESLAITTHTVSITNNGETTTITVLGV